MMKSWFSSALLLLMTTAALQAQSREALLKAVAQHSKWSQAGEPSLYDETNIEALAGKRAATINHYGLSGVTVQDWTGQSGKIRLTLYEMTDASAAYGLFTLERNANQPRLTPLSVGTEAFRVGSREFFWQSKYLIKKSKMILSGKLTQERNWQLVWQSCRIKTRSKTMSAFSEISSAKENDPIRIV